MRKSLLSVTFMVLFFYIASAQDVASKFNNFTIHKGLKGSGMPIQGLEIGYIQHLGKIFELYLPVRLGPRGELQKAYNSETIKTQMLGTAAFDVVLQAKYDNGHNFVIPFVSGGTGVEWYHNGVELGAPVGGGLNFRATPKVQISLATNYRFAMTKTSPAGFCHSLGVIVNLRNNEKPFVSKMPVTKSNSSDEYAKLEAEAQAKREAEAAEKTKKEIDAKRAAEALAKAHKEAQAKQEAEARLAANKAAQAKLEADIAAKEEAVRRAKLQATVPIEVSKEVQTVLNYALKGVQFETGSAQLTPASMPILDEVAATMAKNPNLRIRIEGHTDRTGNESINMKLSEARAKMCLNHLISKGISSERLQNVGFGSSHPLSDNETTEGRSLNRRVEFIPF